MMEAMVMQMTMCGGRVSTLLTPTGGGCGFRAGNHFESHDIKPRSCSDRSVLDCNVSRLWRKYSFVITGHPIGFKRTLSS
ncbi:hypothetical protein BDQ94DRAFT_45431 [Aspergillus welwitschiae]|uniref:Uncharacterized protein n=1 Tax=Aspergillus welwitschiae TaxID=1341132 RepID=A0A3F3QHL5_9EURO|nr:hypothetical protein BDQ94DRAFT_45431 [Aspergillus welwitschiae]RDH38570.1 hypothetical protein BDQ94DRAFT_45431 [Aspergillus welwitschiae]